jgi:dihydrofolate reductase
MRRVRYAVVISLDGYIAGPNGEADWILHNPEIDFAEIFAQYDTALIGRKTFDAMVKEGITTMPGIEIFVFSRTLRQKDYPSVTIVAENPEQIVTELKKKPGKDLWLFGGGSLFRSLADKELVDSIEIAVMPVLLGKGIPLAPDLAKRIKLKLTGNKIYKAGIVSLEYAVQ